jgi:hypothetical protein
MVETLEELTYDSEEEDGTLVRKQLDRAVLTRGGWSTVMFLFQELDRASGKFRAPKMAVVRFKKARGLYRKQSSFLISSGPQARQFAEVFERWYPKMQAAQEQEGDGGDSNGDDGGGDENDDEVEAHDEVENHDAPAAED